MDAIPYFVDWRAAISDADRADYDAAGYGGRLAIGSRPGLLIVDSTYAFVGENGMSPAESQKAYPNSSGPPAWNAIQVIAPLRLRFREFGHPVLYTKGFGEERPELAGLWRAKNTSGPIGPRANEIVNDIAPADGDIVIRKSKPSAFHGSPLTEVLIGSDVDTLIVCGGTTSGCVRATVVDAFSLNYRVLVVEDGVFDRGGLSHAVNLFDMDQKYGDVVPSSRILEFLDSRWSRRPER